MHYIESISNSTVQNNKAVACDVCHFAKHKKSPFTLSNTTSKACFELLHVDVWGPFMVKTLGGERYFLTIVDDYSRFTWIHLMRSKSNTQQLIKNFHKFVHT